MKNINLLREAVKEATPMLEMMIGDKLNHKPQTLKKVERGIEVMFPPNREYNSSIAIMIGMYLGEVIVKNVRGAKWQDLKGNDPFEASITVSGPGGMEGTMKPLIRAHKFINKDRTDGLYPYYCMIQDMIQDRVVHDSGSEWVDARGGTYKYRTIMVSKEEAEAGNFNYEEMVKNRENKK